MWSGPMHQSKIFLCTIIKTIINLLHSESLYKDFLKEI